MAAVRRSVLAVAATWLLAAYGQECTSGNGDVVRKQGRLQSVIVYTCSVYTPTVQYCHISNGASGVIAIDNNVRRLRIGSSAVVLGTNSQHSSNQSYHFN